MVVTRRMSRSQDQDASPESREASSVLGNILDEEAEDNKEKETH